MNKPKYIVVHSTDVSFTKNGNQFNAVNNYHQSQDFPLSRLGYYVGYHRLITGGTNYHCKHDTEIGAHTNQLENGISINKQSLGVCVGFDGDVEYPRIEDYNLLQKQIWSWQDLYAISNQDVKFHRDFNTSKTCPGSLLGNEWLTNLLRRTPYSKPDDQEEKQKEILMQKISILQKIINLWLQIKPFK